MSTKLTDQEIADRDALLMWQYQKGEYVSARHFSRAVNIDPNLANKIKLMCEVNQQRKQVKEIITQNPLDYINDGLDILINAIDNEVSHEELKAIVIKIRQKVKRI